MIVTSTQTNKNLASEFVLATFHQDQRQDPRLPRQTHHTYPGTSFIYVAKMASSRPNEDWERLITSRIHQVQSTNSESHNSGSKFESDFTTIVSPNDPKLPLAIDHTLLKPDATNGQIDELCREARKWGFKV